MGIYINVESSLSDFDMDKDIVKVSVFEESEVNFGFTWTERGGENHELRAEWLVQYKEGLDGILEASEEDIKMFKAMRKPPK